MKEIIAGLIALVVLCGIFFSVIHPIWLKAGSDIFCYTSDSYTESFKLWKKAKDKDVNLDAFSGEFPSMNSSDYRRLILDFNLTSTSVFGVNSMCVYIKDIDCENKKNAIILKSSTYDEAGFDILRMRKENYDTPFILVYVGDLKSEKEIEERLEDIAKHTIFGMTYTLQWLGNRNYSWSAGDKIKGYIIIDGETNKQKRIK